MLRLELDLRWRLGRREATPFDDAVFALLEGIGESESLQAAARRAGLSYRHAWGLLNGWAEALGRPLATLERGRGTRLTPLGSRLLASRRTAEARVGPELARIAAELAAGLSEAEAGGARSLRVHASHDLALRQVVDRLAATHGIRVDLTVRGSHDCLESLARRRCDLAGFHTAPDAPLEAVLYDAFPKGLQEPVVVYRMFQREQGLITAMQQKPPVRTLADVVHTGARFINRQRGSGTRTLFDRLLRQAGLRPSDVRGYHDEEFTHLAVAATVAGGGADVAFGIRAAAAQFGLQFTPLAVETYYLAAREARARDEPIPRIVAFLRSAEFQALCSALPGYDASGAGQAQRIAARGARRSRPGSG
ncbi:MAG: helix-turn-helix transcriptional regulator [Burkholderiales bacterium]|nr:helix-turn-helix transcriptional regulator [Burkholderiales bacterium]